MEYAFLKHYPLLSSFFLFLFILISSPPSTLPPTHTLLIPQLPSES